MKYIFFLLFFLLPRIAFGVVAYDTSGASGASGASPSSLSYSHTVTGANTLLICGVSYKPGGGPSTVSGMTYNAVAMTFGAAQITDATFAKVEVYYLAGAATGAHTAQVNFSGGTPYSAIFDCSSFTGVDSTTPVGTLSTTSTASIGLSCSVPSDGLCYDVAFSIGGISGCAARTPGGSAVKRYDICDGGSAGDAIEHYSSTIATTATMNWDADSGSYEGQIVVPINAFVAAGGAARRRIVTNP